MPKTKPILTPEEKQPDQQKTKPENGANSEIQNILSGYTEEIEITPEEKPEEKPPAKIENRGRKKKELFTNPPTLPPGQLAASDVISGALMLMFIDLAIPNLISFVNNKFSKKKVKTKSMQLTEKQKNELEPFANEAAKQLMLKGNPVNVFIIALFSIYGLNFLMLKNE